MRTVLEELHRVADAEVLSLLRENMFNWSPADFQ